MKIVAWDIEASNLSADFGIVLCVGFKEVGKGKPEVLDILDYTPKDGDLIKGEKKLLAEVSEKLLDSDCWLTHFGTYYDINFVNSRLLYHNLPVLPAGFAHIDTWKTAKARLRLRNNRLATISEFIGTEDEKNAIKPEQWLRALGGHRRSMDYIIEHCRRDVLVLEQVYERLRPLIVDHPNRSLVDGRGDCPTCGGSSMQARGFHVTKTRKYQRYHCQDCGTWSKSTKAVEVAAKANPVEASVPPRRRKRR